MYNVYSKAIHWLRNIEKCLTLNPITIRISRLDLGCIIVLVYRKLIPILWSMLLFENFTGGLLKLVEK